MKKITCLTITLTLLTLGGFAAGCATISKAETKYQNSRLNNNFKYGALSFPEYIKQHRTVIAQARTDLTAVKRNAIISGNSPFELKPLKNLCPKSAGAKPYQRGVLLIHGLSGSPYLMRPLGEFFAKNCFRVMAITLPGHGTRPGDMLDVTWEEWDQAVRYGINALVQESDEIYLAGFSTGGTLAIHAGIHDQRIRGLFLFSPAIEITAWAAIAKPIASMGRIFPRLQWLNNARDDDTFRYESVALNGGYQVHRLTKVIARELKKQPLKIPTFVALSEDDYTIHTAATLQFFAQSISNPTSHMVLYTTQPNVMPAAIPAAQATQVELVNSTFPAEKILSSAHTAMLTPPQDAHYGVNGDYASCVHYSPDSAEYPLCKGEGYEFIGEPIPKYSGNIIRRLMYNPNFTGLQTSLKKFIDDLVTE